MNDWTFATVLGRHRSARRRQASLRQSSHGTGRREGYVPVADAIEEAGGGLRRREAQPSKAVENIKSHRPRQTPRGRGSTVIAQNRMYSMVESRDV